MTQNLLDNIPGWLKSLWNMENELRNAARNGVILRKEEAYEHFSEARRHLEEAMTEAQHMGRTNEPQIPVAETPLRPGEMPLPREKGD